MTLEVTGRCLDYLVYRPKDKEHGGGNPTLAINGNPEWIIILKPKKRYSQKELEDRLYGCCDENDIDYGSPGNVEKCVKEKIWQVNISKRSDYVEEENEEEESDRDDKNTKAKEALELAISFSEKLFLDEHNRAFAAMKVGDHIEIHPMDEQRFQDWISGMFYEVQGGSLLSDDDLKKIIRILRARAQFDSNIPRYNLDVRVRGYNSTGSSSNNNGSNGGYGGNNYANLITENYDSIYYDLTNQKWKAVKITSKGWDIDNHPPILFRRYGSELPQPYPDRNYEPDILDQFLDLLNLKPEHKETQKQLLKPYIVSMFFPNSTPKPILILPASQGSAKTTAFELIRNLVDPNSSLTSSLPRDDNNLKQYLAHNFISFFDNVSYLNEEQSDTLCRAVTGAHDMKRELYKNDSDIIYKYRRIVGLNGITNAATRADLLDRGLMIEFGEISKSDRKLLRVIWRKYYELKPKLLAFCFDVISEVMAERERWKGKDEDYFGMEDLIRQKGGLPRMADWAILAEQISAAIAKREGRKYVAGTFLETFDKNLEALNVEALKSSLVAEALISFMTDREIRQNKNEWEGSATELLAALNNFIESNSESIKINTRSKAWVQDPAVLGRAIARIRPNLRNLGIAIEAKKTMKNNIYFITKMPPYPPLLPYDQYDQNSRSDEDQDRGEKYGSNVYGCLHSCFHRDILQNHAQNEGYGGNGSNGSKISTKKEEEEIQPESILEQSYSIEDILISLLKDEQGNGKGYFTLDDWKFKVMMLSVQDPLHCDENQAEQVLYALIQEGKVQEIELGKFKPI